MFLRHIFRSGFSMHTQRNEIEKKSFQALNCLTQNLQDLESVSIFDKYISSLTRSYRFNIDCQLAML